jgi:hypothetical protein
MLAFLLVLILGTAQAPGPVAACPVVVEVVDPSWTVLPGIQVTVRDERTRAAETKTTDRTGRVQFVVQSCSDDRCRFTVSAVHPGFKTVTLRRLWFGESQGEDRHVQIRLDKVAGPKVTVY